MKGEPTMILDLIERAKKSGNPLDRDYAEAAEREFKQLTATSKSLELALDFYGDVRNYSYRGGDVPINLDLGGKARRVLELVQQQRAERQARIIAELGADYGN
jgi:hypothetical protein